MLRRILEVVRRSTFCLILLWLTCLVLLFVLATLYQRILVLEEQLREPPEPYYPWEEPDDTPRLHQGEHPDDRHGG